MYCKMLILPMAIVVLLLQQEVAGTCNVCSNRHACTSQNEFQLCFNGKPDNSTTYKCPNEDEICTKLSFICVSKVQTPTAVPGCGDTTVCGKCDDVPDGAYSCTSRTTFTMCLNRNLTDIRASCPSAQLCDSVAAKQLGKNPCVKKCSAASAVLCDVNERVDEPEREPEPEPTTTTTEPPTTTTTEPTTTTTTIEPTTTSTTTTTTTMEPTTTTTTLEPTTTTAIISPTPIMPETTTTTTPPTPPTTTIDPAYALCTGRVTAGRYPLPNDTTCLSFAYCFWMSGNLKGVIYNCPSMTYFNAATASCETVKPVSCA